MARAELARQSLDRPDLERPRRRASLRGGAGNYNYKGRTITLQSTIILHSNCFSTNFVQRENYCPSQLSITKRLQVMARRATSVPLLLSCRPGACNFRLGCGLGSHTVRRPASHCSSFCNLGTSVAPRWSSGQSPRQHRSRPSARAVSRSSYRPLSPRGES